MSATLNHDAGLAEGLRLLQEGRAAEAVAALGAAEAAGSRSASMVLGHAYLHGEPLGADPAQAVVHLERAAAEPWGPPEQLLAAIHWIGYGIAPDATRAWRWFERALAAGHAPALRTAGILRAVRGDARGAREQFERARDAGDAFARHSLALLAAAEGDHDAARLLLAAAPVPISARRIHHIDATAWPLDGPHWSPAQGTPPWADPPRRGAVRELYPAPRIQLQDAALSPWECDYVMTVGAPNLQPSRTLDPTGASVYSDPARTSADASLRTLFPDLVVHGVGLAMAELAGLPLERSEALAMLRYGVGQEYREHCDFLNPGTLGSPRWRDQGQRVTTVIAYLNDVASGGTTAFPALSLRVEARAGRLLRFDNVRPDGQGDERSLHCGDPVREGDKWIVTAWFRERPATEHGGGQIPGRKA
jgi:prolyl 4-hydroxylase